MRRRGGRRGRRVMSKTHAPLSFMLLRYAPTTLFSSFGGFFFHLCSVRRLSSFPLCFLVKTELKTNIPRFLFLLMVV